MQLNFDITKQEDVIQLNNYFLDEILKIKQTELQIDTLDTKISKYNNQLNNVGEKLFNENTTEYINKLSEKQIAALQKRYTELNNVRDVLCKQVDELEKIQIKQCNFWLDNVKKFLVLWDKYKADTIPNEMLDFMKRVCKLGLPLYYSNDITKFKGFIELSDDELRKQIVFLFSNNDFLIMRQATSMLTSLDINIEHRYFRNALSCLYNHNYYSCACSMFPLIENVITQTQIFTDTRHRCQFTNGITKYFNNTDYKFFKVAWTNLCSLIDEIYKEFSRKKMSENLHINRHQLEHGNFEQDINLEKCLSLILLYMCLLDNTSIMSLQHLIDEMEK